MNGRFPSNNIKYATLLVYLVGNALTYNYLFKAEMAAIAIPTDASAAMINSLLLACIWPLFWTYKLLVG